MKKIIFILLLPLFSNGQIISTVVGNGIPGYSGDGGHAATAEIYKPDAVAFDRSGNMFFTDCYNYRIRKVSPAGIISTVAGNGSGGHSGDGGAATLAQIAGPDGIAVDSAGDLYISESDSYIRKVNADGIISTIAGTGTFGYNGDGIPATSAQLAYPYIGFVDDSGNVYFGDAGNHRMRKISFLGTVTTIAGNGTNGYSGDGGLAINSELESPVWVTKSPSGDIYIPDNSCDCVRKINSVGVITTFAGFGVHGSSGDGGPATNATFMLLNSINFDYLGNAYIADAGANLIRKVDTSGTIYTVAGTGVGGYAGDGGPATDAEFDGPNYVMCDASNNVFIADLNNSRIREINYIPEALPNISTDPINFYIYPSPAQDKVTISANFKISSVTITDSHGQTVFKQLYNNKEKVVITVSGYAAGIYLLKINGNIEGKFVKE